MLLEMAGAGAVVAQPAADDVHVRSTSTATVTWQV